MPDTILMILELPWALPISQCRFVLSEPCCPRTLGPVPRPPCRQPSKHRPCLLVSVAYRVPCCRVPCCRVPCCCHQPLCRRSPWNSPWFFGALSIFALHVDLALDEGAFWRSRLFGAVHIPFQAAGNLHLHPLAHPGHRPTTLPADLHRAGEDGALDPSLVSHHHPAVELDFSVAPRPSITSSALAGDLSYRP